MNGQKLSSCPLQPAKVVSVEGSTKSSAHTSVDGDFSAAPVPNGNNHSKVEDEHNNPSQTACEQETLSPENSFTSLG